MSKYNNLDVRFFSNPIPKNSKFAINDWILKQSGVKAGFIGRVVGYRAGYYGGGDYLIEFENGNRLRTKQGRLRGPFKTKEIALEFEKNPTLQEQPEHLRLKSTDIRTTFKTLPKTELKLKSLLTQKPYEFKWLDTPKTFQSLDDTNVIITVLAVKNVPVPSFKNRELTFISVDGFNQFLLVRYNNRVTKKLVNVDWSPYQIYYPTLNSTYGITKGPYDFNASPAEQAQKIYKIDRASCKEFLQDSSVMKEKFNAFTSFLSHDKLTPVLLFETVGRCVEINGVKTLKSPVILDQFKYEHQSMIKNYAVLGWIFSFSDEKATNLNNFPLSCLTANIDNGAELNDLSSDNQPIVKKLNIYNATKIKNFKGIEDFKEIEEITIGNRYSHANHFASFNSVEYCPSNIVLNLFELSELKTLRGLPSTLKELTVRTSLDSFDCVNTTIRGRLLVTYKPKSLKGLPKATEYHIDGYTQKEIDDELQFGQVVDRLPELDGLF